MTPQERKDRFNAKQRERENARRAALGLEPYSPNPPKRARKRRSSDRDPKPAYGSQDWAETYGDDLGESPDW